METRQTLEKVTILFGGDSGDGIQLTGSQFTGTSAIFGNDVRTLPDFPSEIRAPAGSLAGVSAYQLNFSSGKVHTPGDGLDILVVMNPSALKVYLPRLKPGGILVVNRDTFTLNNLKKAGYEHNPIDDHDLAGTYRLYEVPITTLTLTVLKDSNITRRAKERCKNFFALGFLYWLYDRPMESSLDWINNKFSGTPDVAEANRLALMAGYHFGETEELFAVSYSVPRAKMQPGTYRLVSGSMAAALGSVTAARLAGKPLLYCAYPITPASDVLHELAKLKHMDVRTIQAEDEIAAMGQVIGASFGGAFAMTGTSGPGICLKSEAIALALMLELPLVIMNVQRAGPSTGMPTKTEQGDLLQALMGRHGESVIPILAPSGPADCFDIVIEAFRIAVRHTTPVIVLSEGYLANSTEPWRIPKFEDLEPIEVVHPSNPKGFQPYSRDEETLARPWVVPGTPQMEHRLGGLEKQHPDGSVTHDGPNHEFMCNMRREKIERIADFIPEQEVYGPPESELLLMSWGGTYGTVLSAVEKLQEEGESVAHVHLRYLNPFPKNLGRIIANHEKILIPELNFGQLALLIRAKYLVDAVSFPKIQGRPFTVSEVEGKIKEFLR